MPAVTGSYESVLGDQKAFRNLRTRAEAERRDRSAAVTAARNYYEGAQWRPLLKSDGVDHNTIVNVCRQVVDRVVAFLFPEMPMLELREGLDTEDETLLREAWENVGGVLKLTEMGFSGALGGHIFSRLYQDEANEIRLVNLNAANVRAYWAGDDVSRALWYDIEYALDGIRKRQDIVRDGQRWLIVDWEYRREWQRTNEAVWPHPLGPIVDWQHALNLHQYYGHGELGHRELNDRINSAASDVAKILHHHGSPRTVATGTGDINPVESGPDVMFTIKNEAAKVYNLEMQSDLSAAMNYMDMLERAFFGESRVVRLSGDVRDMQRVTNLGIRALYIDQLAKNEDLRRRYEWGIREISRRMLMLLGREPARPTVHWPDPLPQDPLETVERMERERALGLVSQQTMSLELGRNPEVEKLRMLAEDNTTGLLLTRLMERPGIGSNGRVGMFE